MTVHGWLLLNYGFNVYFSLCICSRGEKMKSQKTNMVTLNIDRLFTSIRVIVLSTAIVAFTIGIITFNAVATSKLTSIETAMSSINNISDEAIASSNDIKRELAVMTNSYEKSFRQGNSAKLAELDLLSAGDNIVIGSSVYRIATVQFEVTMTSEYIDGISYGSAITNGSLPLGSKFILRGKGLNEISSDFDAIFDVEYVDSGLLVIEDNDELVPIRIFTTDETVASNWGRRLVDGILLVQLERE